MKEEKKYVCDRCHGKGRVDVYHRVDNGFCYKCNGGGKLGYMPMSQRANGPAEQPERDYEAEALDAMESQSRYMRETDAALENFRAESFLDFPSDPRG